MGCRTVNVALAVSRQEQFCCDDLANDEHICPESTAGEVKEPFNDEDDDLLSEGVICMPNGDTNFGDDLGYLQEMNNISVQIDDLMAMFIDGVCHCSVFLSKQLYKPQLAVQAVYNYSRYGSRGFMGPGSSSVLWAFARICLYVYLYLRCWPFMFSAWHPAGLVVLSR